MANKPMDLISYEDLNEVSDLASDINVIANGLQEDFYWDNYNSYTIEELIGDLNEIKRLATMAINIIKGR